MKRLLSFTAIAVSLALLFLAAGSCGKKHTTKPSDGGGSSHRAPISDGTWEVTTTIERLTVADSCLDIAQTTTDTVDVVDGQTDIFGDTTCTFTVTGSTFTESCHDSTLLGGCVLRFSIAGGGTTTATTFTSTVTLTFSDAPTGCSGFNGCQYRVTITGRKLSGIPAPEVVIGLRGMVRRAEDRYVIRHALEAVRRLRR